MQKHLALYIFLSCILILSINTVSFAEKEVFIGENKIAFVSERTGNKDIFVINDNGTDLIQLTDSPQIDENPQWSPDGHKILYISYERSFFKTIYELWVVNLDGTEHRQLDSNIDDDYTPQWSKDGSRILYVAKKDENTIITLINSDGNNKIALTNPEDKACYPSWSPDCSKILYSIQNGKDNGLYLINPDGNNKTPVITAKGNFNEPTLSPDGSMITFVYESESFFRVFDKEEGIYIMSSEGENETIIAKGENISWCPDGKAISFIHQNVSQVNSSSNASNIKRITDYRVFLISLTGKRTQHPLTNNSTNKIIYPAWSPDGIKIAYIQDFSVFIRESGNPKTLKFNVPFAAATPAWSTDSKKIACIGYSALISKPSLYVFDYLEGNIYQLTDGTNDYNPVWSPVIY